MANDYELQRQQQIEKNKQRLAELGLLNVRRPNVHMLPASPALPNLRHRS